MEFKKTAFSYIKGLLRFRLKIIEIRYKFNKRIRIRGYIRKKVVQILKQLSRIKLKEDRLITQLLLLN